MRNLAVPDLDAIGEGATWRLSLDYDVLSQQPMLPLAQMDSCEVRLALDQSVCEALSIDPELVARIRGALASEPSITGEQFAPL